MFTRRVLTVAVLSLFLSPFFVSADELVASGDKKTVSQTLNEMNLEFTPPQGWSIETNYAGVTAYNHKKTSRMQIMSEGYDANILSETERFLNDFEYTIHAKRKMKISGLPANYIEYSFKPYENDDRLQRTRFIVFHSSDKKISYKVAIAALEGEWGKQLPVAEKSLKSFKLLVPEKKTPKKSSVTSRSFIKFSTIPKNVKAETSVLVSWQLNDPAIKKSFPSKGTYISLDVVTADGVVVGSIGDGFTLDKSSWQWSVSKDRYSFVDGGKYKIRATLSYQTTEFTCDPVLSKGKDCSPVYSKSDKALMDKAKKYSSESAVFTIKL